MKEALERTIQTLIDSGGDPWEYDSNDIQTLVKWIEEQQKLVKNNAVLPLVIGSASCECQQKHLKHIKDQNSYPHGEWIEYDQCTECDKIHNMKVH